MHSFVKKRVHICGKTTACFVENDGLFLVKRRVVLWQTTACFFVLFERWGFLVFLVLLALLAQSR